MSAIKKSSFNVFSYFAIMAVLTTVGCASVVPPAKVASLDTRLKAMLTTSAPEGGGGGSACLSTWKYPEMTGKTDNWVDTYNCAQCSAEIPGQSPTVLDPTTALTIGFASPTCLNSPSFSMNPVRITSTNNYSFAVSPNSGPPLTVQWYNSEITWTFVDFHFHVPAEHVIVGQPVSVMEMHVKAMGVMASQQSFQSVFAIQFVVGPDPSMLMAPIAAAISTGNGSNFLLGSLMNLFTTQGVFMYGGSLTTPTCAPIFFFVLSNPVVVDQASWQTVATTLLSLNGVSNVRPLQTRVLASNPVYAQGPVSTSSCPAPPK